MRVFRYIAVTGGLGTFRRGPENVSQDLHMPCDGAQRNGQSPAPEENIVERASDFPLKRQEMVGNKELSKLPPNRVIFRYFRDR